MTSNNLQILCKSSYCVAFSVDVSPTNLHDQKADRRVGFFVAGPAVSPSAARAASSSSAGRITRQGWRGPEPTPYDAEMTRDMDDTTENGGTDRRPRPNRNDRLHDQRLQRERRRMPILSTTRRRTMSPGAVMGFPAICRTAANNATPVSMRTLAGDISANSASPDGSSERHPRSVQARNMQVQRAYEIN